MKHAQIHPDVMLSLTLREVSLLFYYILLHIIFFDIYLIIDNDRVNYLKLKICKNKALFGLSSYVTIGCEFSLYISNYLLHVGFISISEILLQ